MTAEANTDQLAREGVEAIVAAITARVTDREALIWLWPQLEKQLTSYDGICRRHCFPVSRRLP